MNIIYLYPTSFWPPGAPAPRANVKPVNDVILVRHKPKIMDASSSVLAERSPRCESDPRRKSRLRRRREREKQRRPAKAAKEQEAKLARRKLRDTVRRAAQSISEAREAQLQRLGSN